MESNKTLNKAKEDSIYGLPYTYTDPPYTKGGRYCTHIIIRNPETMKKVDSMIVSGMTFEKLHANREKAIEGYHEKRWELIRTLILNHEYKMPLDYYCQIRKDSILEVLRTRGTTEPYEFIWSDMLPGFHTVNICDLIANETGAEKIIKEKMEECFDRGKSKHAITKEERLTWAFLSAVFNVLTDDGFLERNPVSAIARKMAVLESTKASRAFNQRSFSERDSERYLKLISLEENETVKIALLVHFLTGITYYELCGLNIDSFVPGSPWMPGHLEILRQYVQKSGKPAELTEILQSFNCYRKFPCSQVLISIFTAFVYKRKKENAKPDDPLFLYEGKRLEPNTFKKIEKDYLGCVFSDLQFDMAHTDFVRTNAEMHFKNYCGMTASQTGFLLGKDRVETYGRIYVDWHNPLVQFNMSSLLDRWHSRMLTVNSKQNRPFSEAFHHFIIGTASNGSRLIMKNNNGFEMSLDAA